jgi:hypothetical protein
MSLVPLITFPWKASLALPNEVTDFPKVRGKYLFIRCMNWGNLPVRQGLQVVSRHADEEKLIFLHQLRCFLTIYA